MTAEKYGATKCALWDVIACVNTDDLFRNMRSIDEHILIDDVEIVVGRVIFIVRETIKRDTRHVHAGTVDDAFIISRRGGEVAFVMIRI